EDRRLRLPTLAAEGFGGLLPISFALVLRELLAHTVFLLPRAFCVRSTDSRSGCIRRRRAPLPHAVPAAEKVGFPGPESYSYRLQNEYIAGISLCTVWTSSSLDRRKSAEICVRLLRRRPRASESGRGAGGVGPRPGFRRARREIRPMPARAARP